MTNPSDEEEMRFANLVKSTRLDLGLTQTELGDLVGKSQRWISDIESGHTKRPRPDLINSLAVALNIDPTELFLISQMSRQRTSQQRAHLSEILSKVQENNPRLRLFMLLEEIELTEDRERTLRSILTSYKKADISESRKAKSKR